MSVGDTDQKSKKTFFISCPTCGIGLPIVALDRAEAINSFEIYRPCSCGGGFLVGEIGYGADTGNPGNGGATPDD
jgi:hypothetical protein